MSRQNKTAEKMEAKVGTEKVSYDSTVMEMRSFKITSCVLRPFHSYTAITILGTHSHLNHLFSSWSIK